MDIQISVVLQRVRFLILSFFFSLIFTNGYTQNKGFKPAKDLIKEESATVNTHSQKNSTAAKSLIEDLHSAVYFDEGKVKTYGVNPKCLFVMTISNLALAKNAFDKDSIEIVTLKIASPSELFKPIDLSVFSEFKALRIIYVVVPFECSINQLNKFIQNQSTDYHLIYTIEKLT